jgi:hypothetical protein
LESEFWFDDFSTAEFKEKIDRNIWNQKQNWKSASNGGPRNWNWKLEFPTKGANFPLVAAMVVVVVMPVVGFAKATEKCNNNTKISCLWSIFVFITIYCQTYMKIHVTLIVAWTEPKPF